MRIFPFRRLAASLALFATLALSGCGWLADPDRIVVARVDGEPIRREDLDRLLRDMLPEERPIIRSRGDLLRLLNEHIDLMLKQKLYEEMKDTQDLTVPRDLAADRFDARHPQFLAAVRQGDAMGLSQAETSYYETEREYRIDRVQQELLGEAAVMARIREETEDGSLEVTAEEYQEEYAFQKDLLKNWETVEFQGLVFPLDEDKQKAGTLATSAYERIRAGEPMGALAAQYEAAGTAFALDSALQNDPRQAARYGTFWEQVSGASRGDVVGPIYIRNWEGARPNAQGQLTPFRIPEAFLVARVTGVTPETQMTLEEARGTLAPTILYAKMIAKLREEHEVEVIEEALPTPGAYDDSQPKSVFDTGTPGG